MLDVDAMSSRTSSQSRQSASLQALAARGPDHRVVIVACTIMQAVNGHHVIGYPEVLVFSCNCLRHEVGLGSARLCVTGMKPNTQ